MKEFNLIPLEKDSCILYRRPLESDKEKLTLIIAIYVDDGLVCCNSSNLIDEVIKHLRLKFEITVMNPECFVGLQISRDRLNGTLKINQEYYIKRIIKRFELQNAKGASTPADSNQKLTKAGNIDGDEHETVNVPYREAIGSLMYAMIGTRPDIAYAVSFLARFSEAPKLIHWNAVKRIFRYLKETSSYGLTFRGSTSESPISCYVDSD